MRVGDAAPDFELPTQRGDQFHLKDWNKKKNIVLVFYPKDFTSGCTNENCLFASHISEIEDLEGLVVGVNSDSLALHGKFADEYHLPYALASDPNKSVCRAYDAVWLFGLGIRRITYVIDKEGIIRGRIHNELSMNRHWEYVLRVLRELRERATN